jgi:LysM repeat protein
MQVKRWIVLGLMAAAALTVVALKAEAVQAAQNLITNPGFEGAFVTSDAKTSVGQGWSPWWIPRPAGMPDWSYNQPDYIASAPCGAICDHRIHSGGNAQRIFQYFGSYVAGVYQQINVPPNADVRLTAFGQSWSSQTEQPQNVSNNGTQMHLRIGIDPLGGTNPLDPRVVWSSEADALDSWQQFQVFARAQGTQVTVFLYAAPDDARRKNEVYWDDVSLEVLSGNLAATAQATYPTATPLPVVIPPTAISVALGQNLLVDGSFEGKLYIPCSRYDTFPWLHISCEGLDFEERVPDSRQRVNLMWNTVMVPLGWKGWWLPPNTNRLASNFYQNHPNNCYADAPEDCVAWHNPEFRDTKKIAVGPSRIHSGQNSVKYFTFWSVHQAGVLQTVAVPPGSTLRFSAWMHAWSTNEDGREEFLETYRSTGQTSMHMKVGIDPCGGEDPWSPSVVWSSEHDTYDQYGYYEVRATAQCDKVTVFTHSMPNKAMKHNDVYVDDAELVVIDGAGMAAPVPVPPQPGNPAPQTSSSVVNAVPAPTALPRPDGAIVHVVKAGDTIFGLALQYDVPMDQILQLNGLTKDSFIRLGQELVIAAPLSATATPVTESTALAPTLTPTPAQIAQAMKEVTGKTQLCVSAFDDVNGDGLLTKSEKLLRDTIFTISDDSGASLASYTSDGASEPHCFTRLQPGSYIVAIEPANGALPTSDRRWSIPLEQGTTIHLNFGSQPGKASASSTNDSSASGTAIGLLLVAAVGGGVGWLIYRQRKNAGIS